MGQTKKFVKAARRESAVLPRSSSTTNPALLDPANRGKTLTVQHLPHTDPTLAYSTEEMSRVLTTKDNTDT